jgi:transcriptional regulator of acetoin/glycerol metabolism
MISQHSRARLIEHSWRRSQLSGLDPAGGVDALPRREFDADSLLLRCARPVLDRVFEEIGGSDYCVMLADSSACVVSTRWGSGLLAERFEALGPVDGAVFVEGNTGTNSVATAFELRQGIWVNGDEHFMEALRDFNCYGHPIIDPYTRKLVGVLDLTSTMAGSNPLLGPYIRQAAAEIAQRILGSRTDRDQAMLTALQHELGAARHRAAVALSGDLFLATTAAVELLETDDHAMLRELAADSVVGVEGALHTVRLSGNRIAQIRRRRIDDSGTTLLTIAHVRSALAETTAFAAETPASTVIITGEPGTGLTTAIHTAAAGKSVSVHDAPSLVGRSGRTLLLNAIASHQVVAVEHIDRLAAPHVAVLEHLIKQGGVSVVMTSTCTVDALPRHCQPLLSHCTERVHLMPLRQRTDTIPDLVRSILRGLGVGDELRFTPAAMEALCANQWDGNVRELFSVVSRAAAQRRAGDITRDDLPEAYRQRSTTHPLTAMEQAKRTAIVDALKRAGGDKKRAASYLGISRTTLYSALRAYDISVSKS